MGDIEIGETHLQGSQPRIPSPSRLAPRVPNWQGQEAPPHIGQFALNKVCLNAFVTNEVGNRFWQKMGWTLREDLNYYDYALNENNLTVFNK